MVTSLFIPSVSSLRSFAHAARWRYLASIAGIVLLTAGSVLAGLPDLTVSPSDIVFTNDSPEPGEQVTIQATVHNNGDVYFEPSPFVYHEDLTGSASDFTTVHASMWLAQYFVPDTDVLLGKVSLLLRNAGDTGDAMTVEIRRDIGNELRPKSFAEGLVTSQTVISTFTSFGWQDFTFDPPPALNAGTTYWICMENYVSVFTTNAYHCWLDVQTPVDMLTASTNEGSTWVGIVGNYIAYFRAYDCADTQIACYDDDPMGGALPFETITLETPIPAAGSRTVSFTNWQAPEGTSTIYVAVDRPGAIAETDNGNNIASKSITAVPTVPGIIGQVSPKDGSIGVSAVEPVRVAFSEVMNSTAAKQAVTIRILRDNQGLVPDDPSVACTASYDSEVVTLTGPWAKGHTYRVTVSTSAHDLYGNGLAAPKTWTFSTVMGSTEGNACIDGGTNTSIIVEPGTLDDDYFILIDTDPATEQGVRGRILAANDKIRAVRGGFSSPVGGSLRKLSLYRGAWPGTLYTGIFGRNVRVVIPYTETADGLIRDDSGRLVREKTLAVYRLDEGKDLWVRIPNSEIDTVNNTVSAGVGHFSLYALLGGTDSDLSHAYAYPVPWKPFDGSNANGTLEDGITFTGLGSEATVRIYTISGELARVLNYRYEGGAEELTWDGKNSRGELVASGAYIYCIENAKERKTGKLLVIK